MVVDRQVPDKDLFSWLTKDLEELERDQCSTLINKAHISQPSCTAIQIALFDLLSSWDIKPISVVGHSSGEIAAAYAAGAIDFATGILLAYHRGTAVIALQETFPMVKGAMLAVGGTQTEIDTLVKTSGTKDTVKACLNSPASVTFSGDDLAIEALDKAAKQKGLFSRKLQTDVAYHSHHMILIADHYRSQIGEVRTGAVSRAAFHSSLLGCEVENNLLGSQYWVNNLTSPVLFNDAVTSLWKGDGSPDTVPDILLEIGPHSALHGPIRQIIGAEFCMLARPEYLNTLTRFEDSVETMLQTVATLVAKGSRPNLPAINFPTVDPRQPVILTDLETYPWNHSKKYWYESRIARGYRLRQGPRNDILGVPAADFNELEPRWRNVIKSEELPWLEQHKVQGNIVWPMSGYISMAIEAMRSRAESRGLKVARYLLREVSSSRALVFPSDITVETMLTLRPYNESITVSSDKWDEFRIFSWTEDLGWTEHCRGVITIESNKVRSMNETFVASIKDNCTSKINSDGLYNMLENMGIEYGSLFKGIFDLAVGSKCSMGTVSMPDTAASMPYAYETPSVVHPVTLDTIFQFVWPTVTGAALNLKALYVPSYIKSLAISPEIIASPGSRFTACGHQSQRDGGSQKLVASLYANLPQPYEADLAVEVENFTLTQISDGEPEPRDCNLAFKLDWKPDIDHLNTAKLQTISTTGPATLESLRESLILELASLSFFQRALAEVPHIRFAEMPIHYQKFYKWMKKVCETGMESSVLLQSQKIMPPHFQEDYVEQARQLVGARGKLTCLFGENLPAILLGHVDALSLLLKDDLLKDYYSSQDSITRSYQHACQYIDCIAHQNPALRILEIGAGTGGVTLPLLETIGGGGGKQARVLKYDFTDVSSGFFDSAKERFETWASLISYRVLDIERDPSDQGFEEGAYDVIVAANVLHATKLLTSTMKNVHRLLKPGGKLILIEETVPTLHRFPFATLPGWWLSEFCASDRERLI